MSRSRVSRQYRAVVLAVFLVATCGSAPDVAIEPQDSDLVARGAQLYAASCAECHGEDLGGTDKGPSLLSFVYEPNHHSDGAFGLAVLRGSSAHHWDFGPMLPVVGLSEEEVDAIVAFVRERQRVEGFEPYPP